MLGKLFAAVYHRGSDEAVAEHQPAELPSQAMQFKPMVPLRPPPAHNDDVMQHVSVEVEKALRASGHLR